MNTTNSIPEICELGIRIVSAPDQEGCLICAAELRLHNGDIQLGDEVCEVSVSKLTISIDLEGLEPVPGSRHGEPRRPNATRIDRTVTQTNAAGKSYKAASDASLNTTTPALRASAGGEISGSTAHETALTVHDQDEHLRVRAIPSLRWEVSEPDGAQLSGTYLNGESLLGLARAERANRSSLSVRVGVRQRDLNINHVVTGVASLNFFNKIGNTQKRLLNIFITKSLSAAVSGSGKYLGEIILSDHSGEIRDEE